MIYAKSTPVIYTFILIFLVTISSAQGDLLKAKGGNYKKGEKVAAGGCHGITYLEHPSKGRLYGLAYKAKVKGIEGRYLKPEYSIIEKMEYGRYYAVSEEETLLIEPNGGCSKNLTSYILPPFSKVEHAGVISNYTPPGHNEALSGPVFLGIMKEEDEDGKKRYDGYLFMKDLSIIRVIPSIKPVEDFLLSAFRSDGAQFKVKNSPNVIHPNPDLQKTFIVPFWQSFIFCLDHPEGSMYMLTDNNFENTVPVFTDLYPFSTRNDKTLPEWDYKCFL
jgi:hypothetical protein